MRRAPTYKRGGTAGVLIAPSFRFIPVEYFLNNIKFNMLAFLVLLFIAVASHAMPMPDVGSHMNDLDAIRVEMLLAVNRYRQSKGLASVCLNR